jgi:hypothetical protein
MFRWKVDDNEKKTYPEIAFCGVEHFKCHSKSRVFRMTETFHPFGRMGDI